MQCGCIFPGEKKKPNNRDIYIYNDAVIVVVNKPLLIIKLNNYQHKG